MSSLGGVPLDILVLCVKVVDTTRVFFIFGGRPWLLRGITAELVCHWTSSHLYCMTTEDRLRIEKNSKVGFTGIQLFQVFKGVGSSRNEVVTYCEMKQS